MSAALSFVVLDDGRVVAAASNTPAVAIGAVRYPWPDWFVTADLQGAQFVDAVMWPDGTVLVAAHAQNLPQGNICLMRCGQAWGDGFGEVRWAVDLGPATSNAKVMLDDLGRLVAVRFCQPDVTFHVIDVETGAAISAVALPGVPSWARSVLDLTPDGQVIYVPPVPGSIGGVACQFAITRGNVTIAAGFNVAQCLIEIDGVVGTLVDGPCFDPRLSRNGHWFCCHDGRGHVSSGLVPAVAPPLVVADLTPTYGPFTHPVSMAPFKDLEPSLATPDAEIVVNGSTQLAARPAWATLDSLAGVRGRFLGCYTEGADLAQALEVSRARRARVLFCQDGPTRVVIPAGLDPARDVIALELYIYLSLPETIDQTLARFDRNLTALLADWHGLIALVPMLYDAGGAPPQESFTPAQVLATHATLTALVNRSPRIVQLSPFELTRANGVSAHPELAAAYNAMAAACRASGSYAFPPVVDAPPAPRPHPTPDPIPAPPPTPAPVPVPPVEEDVPNPTDQISYADAFAAMAARRATHVADYGQGALDAYRVFAEGTSLADAAADRSHPAQTPQPNVTYGDWVTTSTALAELRHAHKTPAGYAEGFMDTFRRFGGEHWPLEYVIADAIGAEHPSLPFTKLF